MNQQQLEQHKVLLLGETAYVFGNFNHFRAIAILNQALDNLKQQVQVLDSLQPKQDDPNGPTAA